MGKIGHQATEEFGKDRAMSLQVRDALGSQPTFGAVGLPQASVLGPGIDGGSFQDVPQTLEQGVVEEWVGMALKHGFVVHAVLQASRMEEYCGAVYLGRIACEDE